MTSSADLDELERELAEEPKPDKRIELAAHLVRSAASIDPSQRGVRIPRTREEAEAIIEGKRRGLEKLFVDAAEAVAIDESSSTPATPASSPVAPSPIAARLTILKESFKEEDENEDADVDGAEGDDFDDKMMEELLREYFRASAERGQAPVRTTDPTLIWERARQYAERRGWAITDTTPTANAGRDYKSYMPKKARTLVFLRRTAATETLFKAIEQGAKIDLPHVTYLFTAPVALLLSKKDYLSIPTLEAFTEEVFKDFAQ